MPSRLGVSRTHKIDMDIKVKGKGSIRTLIRLANSRAINEASDHNDDE